LNAPFDIKNKGYWYSRQEFDFLGGHDDNELRRVLMKQAVSEGSCRWNE
jgi:hypothetical protein